MSIFIKRRFRFVIRRLHKKIESTTSNYRYIANLYTLMELKNSRYESLKLSVYL